MNRKLLTALLAFTVSVFLLVSLLPVPRASAAPPLSGAIFTTNATGTRVNQNHFNDKCEVYLDGGPSANAPQWAAGLPDGDYYFQVTDPSGKTLLSTDPVVNRQFRVTAGIISGLSGLGNHVTGTDVDCGATTIQLCPYLDTPNNGGVYKVWVTRIEDFVGNPNNVDSPCGRGCFHGFIPAASKTDNYKVKSTKSLPCIDVTKFIDFNDNKKFDPGTRDFWFTGWPITITGPLGDQVNGQLFTPAVVCNLEPGNYIVTEGANPLGNHVVVANILDGVVLPNPDADILVKVKANSKTQYVIFGNTW